jgi:hypothetical protein
LIRNKGRRRWRRNIGGLLHSRGSNWRGNRNRCGGSHGGHIGALLHIIGRDKAKVTVRITDKDPIRVTVIVNVKGLIFFEGKFLFGLTVICI